MNVSARVPRAENQPASFGPIALEHGEADLVRSCERPISIEADSSVYGGEGGLYRLRSTQSAACHSSL